MAQPPDIAPVLTSAIDGLDPRQAAHEAGERACDEPNFVLALNDAIAE
jgi:hypothetical protein